MAPTTFTSIVMVLIGVVLLTVAGYAWFGSWQPEPRRPREQEVDAAVAEMRRAIEAYERAQQGEHPR